MSKPSATTLEDRTFCLADVSTFWVELASNAFSPPGEGSSSSNNMPFSALSLFTSRSIRAQNIRQLLPYIFMSQLYARALSVSRWSFESHGTPLFVGDGDLDVVVVAVFFFLGNDRTRT
eukprot:CAMPEP_0198262256 /NCGR_PEP_ID=MMETSP1447-20131203/10799_1 /TAXON_ID=420782 /ORGANISM="Chaetoceros dichaeta, Strain CCMP1751" /LENGTH=118 /DNA_ID=CAMNT_0043950433 /DNA_START=704 /DNA_END=1056 /DNA_ORIENTATION=-